MKLKYDESLSNSAFNFNLRRYTLAWNRKVLRAGTCTPLQTGAKFCTYSPAGVSECGQHTTGEDFNSDAKLMDEICATVGQCRLTVSTSVLKAPMV